MSRINIDHLTEGELIDLNHRVVERLRLLHQLHAHKAMLEFRIGDRVTFDPQGGNPISGILTRYNKKTVSVLTDSGDRWNVAPRLLRRSEPAGEAHQDSHPNSVIPFKQR